jgi:hypothetical protein
MKTPINTVVPQPGATLPYSEFIGFSNYPNGVTKLVSKPSCLIFAVDFVAINQKNKILFK